METKEKEFRAGGSVLFNLIIAVQTGDEEAARYWFWKLIGMPVEDPPGSGPGPGNPASLTLEQLTIAHCTLKKIKDEFDSIHTQLKKVLGLPEVIKFVYKR
jgi:hypothetical protein